MIKEFDELHKRIVQRMNSFLHKEVGNMKSHLHKQNPSAPDWKALRPYFGWLHEGVIKHIYMLTTRFAGTLPHNDDLK